jgi:hypothetical protein
LIDRNKKLTWVKTLDLSVKIYFENHCHMSPSVSSFKPGSTEKEKLEQYYDSGMKGRFLSTCLLLY